jgi:hypothetical protein
MRWSQTSRRAVLTAAASCTLAGIASTQSMAEDNTNISNESYHILEGTDHETTIYETTASTDGPTVLVVGGVHGNEVAGYEAAGAISEWEIDTGTLVTIPEAAAEAVEDETRTYDDGVDLNRQFPEGEVPETELAEAIWEVVTDYNPDVVIDLHESTGVYAGDPVDGVGQAIFHSESAEAVDDADQAVNDVNSDHVDDPEHEFMTGSFSGPENEPSGLLVHKTARDLDAHSFLIETLSRGPDLDTRIHWQTQLVEHLVEERLLSAGEDSDDQDADEPDESETGDEQLDAVIETTPENAEDSTLEEGQTVELDATSSHAPDGEIICYEWDLDDDGNFEDRGAVTDVTLSSDGDQQITLRVVDDTGAEAIADTTLSTN